MTNLEIKNKNLLSKPTLCKDGTTQKARYERNKSTGKPIFFSACLGRGGAMAELRSEPYSVQAEYDKQDKRVRKQYKGDKRVRKQYIIYGLIAVAGYFAYKKFKK